MTLYTFEGTCSVTVDAETEKEARHALIRSCQEQDEDVEYGEVSVYIPSYGDFTLTDTYDDGEAA